MRSHQHKTHRKAPSLEEVLQSYCDVCFVPFDKQTPRSLEQGLDILVCSKCHIHVHRCCYDFQPQCTAISENVSEFVCDRCQKEKPGHCLVCYGTEGPMKKCGDELIHVYCGLTHNDIQVVSYNPTLQFRKSPQYQQSQALCEICNKKNAHDQCAQQSCRRKVHTYCARVSYIEKQRETQQPHSWNHHLSVGNHGNFDLSDEILPYQLVSEEIDNAFKPIEEMGYDLAIKEGFKTKFHKAYLQEQRSRRKSTKKLRRGGFSYVLCPAHQSPQYCLCYGKSQGDMVLCQCCFQWYHHRCVNFQPDTMGQDSYICRFCKTFYDFKRKAIEQVKGGRVQLDVGKIQLPVKISVADVMWVMRILDNRLRNGQITKMGKQLNKYPLKSSCMDILLRFQNKTRLQSLCGQFLILFWGSEVGKQMLRSRVVLGWGTGGVSEVLWYNVQWNRRLGKVCALLSGSGVPLSHLQKQLQFKEKAITDQYQQIIELSTSRQPYQEVSILKQKAQAYTFLPMLSLIQNNQNVNFIQLKSALSKAQSLTHPPIELINTLKAKHDTAQPLVLLLISLIQNQPESPRINQLVVQLQQIHISAPNLYIQLKSQKKFIQELYLYYIKQQGLKLDESLSIRQQIQQLRTCQKFKASSQYIQIVSRYQLTQRQIWTGVKQILVKSQRTALDYQFRQIIKRKMCKRDYLEKLVQRVKLYQFSGDEQISKIVQNWQSIMVSSDNIRKLDMQKLDSLQQMQQILGQIQLITHKWESFPFRIQQESSNSVVSLLKIKKDEIQQLRTLYTQSLLPKNPLSLHRIMSSLPKTNPLVKRYLFLKKQQNNITSSYLQLLTRSSQKIQFFTNQSKNKKLQRKQQISLNSQKPSLSEVTQLLEQCKESGVQLSTQIKELTRLVNNSLELGGRVKKYLQERGGCQYCGNDQLSVRRKEIDQLRRKILNQAQISLKVELVELYHVQIVNRMRTSVLSPTLDLQKINMILKFAQEQSLTHFQTYKTLKQKFQSKSQKSKQFTLIKNFQTSLSTQALKDTTGHYGNLYVFRKSLHLPQITENKTKNPYLDELMEKNKALRVKLANMLKKSSGKMQLNEAKAVYLQALKNPYFQPDITHVAGEMSKAFEIQRKWKDLKNNLSHLHPIFLDYQDLLFTIEEIEVVKNQLKLNQQQIKKMDAIDMQLDEYTRDQLEDIIERIEGNAVIKESDLCRQAQEKYIAYWLRLLDLYQTEKKIVPYQKIKRLLIDSYAILQRLVRVGASYQHIRGSVNQLQDYMGAIKAHLRDHPHSEHSYLAQGFIDLQDLYLDNQDQKDIVEAVPLLRPFLDLSKFKTRNLSRLQIKREEFGGKRSRQKIDQMQMQSQKQIARDSPEQQELPKVVSDVQRRKIKQIFLKNIRKNPQLKKYGQCQNQVKMIQNQIFGQWHNQIQKYFQLSQQFQKLFMRLVSCPNISNKIAKKKFQFKFIQLLVNNLGKLDELEGMIVSKIKQQQNEKTISGIVEAGQKEKEVNNEQRIQHMRQDLKKQIKMIKQSKNKKKKHHKHRSRSRSPQAKFSSQSEKQMPSYIEKEYNRDQGKGALKEMEKKVSESPLRYDPQEQAIQQRQTLYPKGSLLKLKVCQLDIYTKKSGKAQIKVNIMTDQQHRKILTQLFDPGFTRLSIRKDKNQTEILQYLNRSKKKYKYLVGWFQSTDPKENHILLDIAEECTEKHKIYGWQADNIKVHIMSIKQLIGINKFNPPGRVSTKIAAQVLKDQRLLVIIQYPQKIYEVRDQYRAFQGVQKTQEFQVNIPAPIIQPPPVTDYYRYTMPTIQPLNKISYQEPKMVYQGGWGNQGILPIPQAPPPVPYSSSIQTNLPGKVNQLRQIFGFGNYSPIISDQQDENAAKKEDLAGNLLNQLGDLTKIPSLTQPQPIQPEKPAQNYQPYYGNYGYQPPRPIPQDNRWMNYQNNPVQAQSYNPLNPMQGKYIPPVPQMPAQPPNQFKNPMMPPPPNPMMGGQRMQASNPMMGGQFYRQGEGYRQGQGQGQNYRQNESYGQGEAYGQQQREGYRQQNEGFRQNEAYRPPQTQGYRPPEDAYRPQQQQQGQTFRPPQQGQAFRPQQQGQNYRPGQNQNPDRRFQRYPGYQQ